MPFSPNWADRTWKIIKETFEAEGKKITRADELFGHDIMKDIWQSICEAQYIVADVTGKNANVFYELGLCHALGKEPILVTQDIEDIPFDIRQFRHIKYQDNTPGEEAFRKTLSDFIKKR
jgi:hypothetical protein